MIAHHVDCEKFTGKGPFCTCTPLEWPDGPQQEMTSLRQIKDKLDALAREIDFLGMAQGAGGQYFDAMLCTIEENLAALNRYAIELKALYGKLNYNLEQTPRKRAAKRKGKC